MSRLWLVTIAGLAFAGPAFAEGGEVEALRALLAEQRALIAAQEGRIAALEQRLGAQPAAAPLAAAQGSDPTVNAVGVFPDDAIVRPGPFAGSVTIPGTDLALRIGGFAQLDVIQDLEESGSGDAFLASAIPLDGDRRGRSRIGARNSRLNVDVRGQTNLGAFRVFLEGDFGGAGGDERATNGSALRLRHAFGQLGNLYAGQYWSLFADVAAFPETLDTTSPASKSVTRQAGVRWVQPLADGLSLSLAAENSEAEIAGAEGLDTAPDLLAGLTLKRAWGHVQLVGLGRRLSTEIADATGWGVTLTGRVRTPLLHAKDNVVFGVTGGEGVGRYLVELGFDELDAAFDPETERLRPISAWGRYLGAQHFWSARLRSTLAAGAIEIGDGAVLAPTAPRRLATASINLVWSASAQTTFGLEALHGRRETQAGEAAEATRLHAIARFGF